MKDWRHVHQRISEHETSGHHGRSTEAFHRYQSSEDVSTAVGSRMLSARKVQIMECRKVLCRIIETVKLIGKRGLSYRGKEFEAAYTLCNKDVDHGNFLEILLLLATFDPLLKSHLEKVTEASERRRRALELQSGRGKQGRGRMVSLISKTTVNRIISVITTMIKTEISKEVQEAGMFSVHLDTTQDISVADQCSIILRYVTDRVHERLVSLKNCTSTTGKAICDLLCDELDELNIDVKTCVGNSTDGAGNMQGEYEGFNAHLSEVAPLQVHVWCYSHVLNLVFVSTTQVNTESVTLFGVVNSVANFVRESYKRMDVFSNYRDMFQSQELLEKIKKTLVSLSKTRFWAKEKALINLFGQYDGDPVKSLYVPLILTLEKISTCRDSKGRCVFNNDIRYQATTLKNSLLSFRTLLTAHVYLRLFSRTSRLSTYLQTSRMDILQTQRMVATTTESLKKIQRGFEDVGSTVTTPPDFPVKKSTPLGVPSISFCFFFCNLSKSAKLVENLQKMLKLTICLGRKSSF